MEKWLELTDLNHVIDEGYWWDEVSSYLFSSGTRSHKPFENSNLSFIPTSRASSSPRKDSASSTLSAIRNAPATSFDDFQQSVDDAWDLGDDEFCVISGKFLVYVIICFMINMN